MGCNVFFLFLKCTLLSNMFNGSLKPHAIRITNDYITNRPIVRSCLKWTGMLQFCLNHIFCFNSSGSGLTVKSGLFALFVLGIHIPNSCIEGLARIPNEETVLAQFCGSWTSVKYKM